MFKRTINKVLSHFSSADIEAYQEELKAALQGLDSANMIDYEKLKTVLNLTKKCALTLRGIYYLFKEQKFEEYNIIKGLVAGSGHEARELLEERVGKELKKRFGEEEFRKYNTNPYISFMEMTQFIVHFEKPRGVTIHLKYKTGEKIAHYDAMIKPL